MLQNKYTLKYNQIVTRAATRTLTGYKENHHIVPQSMGGLNEKANMVFLTAREHFICHWLLTKMTTGDDRARMVYALRMMSVTNDRQNRYKTQITARVYETYRKEHAANHSKVMKGKPAWNKGRKLEGEELERSRERTKNRKKMTPEVKAKWIADRVAKNTGKKRTEEFKMAHSLRLSGIPKGPMSEEEKLKRSVTQTGVKKSKSHASNIAAAVLGNIAINKDNIEKKVKQPDLQTWLNQGWSIGGKKRIRE